MPGPTLFVSYSGTSGGAERILVDVASGLPEGAVVACPPGRLADLAREAGLHVVAIGERPLELRTRRARAAASLVDHARELRGLVRTLEPSVLVTWGMRSGLAAGMLRPRSAWIASHVDFLPGGGAGRAVRRALARADAVCAISRSVERDLALDRPVVVITPGVDLDGLRPPTARPAGPPKALWAGAIVPWKRPDLALAVAERLPEVCVLIAGEPLDPAGERLLSALRDGPAQLVGRVDTPEALRTADVLLHTADREPFGLVLAEALACGVPVVAPRSGGPAEIVDESCGRLFIPGDADSATAAVRSALAEREGLSAGARRRAEERFDVRRAQQEYAGLIRQHRPAAPPTRTDIALVTVTHNSREELAAFLRSARRHLPDAEVVVVDSGSSDGSGDLAREWGARVLELTNVGYGRGSNEGLRAVTRPVSVVVNPDVELVDGSLAVLASELERENRLLVPAVVLPDGRRQDVAHHEPGAAVLAAHALLPAALLPARLRPLFEPWRAMRPRRVGWGVGACVAGRTETLRSLGPFDSTAFLYAEDLDLGMRAADAGVETWYWPRARVLHKRAHSTARAFGGEPFDLLARRRREVVTARRGAARARRDDVLQALTFLDRIALKTLARRDTGRERRQLRALMSARRAA